MVSRAGRVYPVLRQLVVLTGSKAYLNEGGRTADLCLLGPNLSAGRVGPGTLSLCTHTAPSQAT